MYFKEFPKTLYDFDITTKAGEGTQAVLEAIISGGGVTAVNIIDGGSGYTSANIGFSAPDNQDNGGVTATARPIIENGSVITVVITNQGTGYTSAPDVSISTPYKLNTKTKALVMTDITKNIRFRRDILANVAVYDEYDIVDGETPEIIAERIYGDAQYHWVIMLANDRYDYRADFPLQTRDLEQYISDKYGNQVDAIRHYENSKGIVVDSDYPGAVSISNRQYEEKVNESKRRIKIISPSLINTIIKNYKDLL